MLQTMYGLGKEDNIVGATNAQKQATLYNKTTHATAPGARMSNSSGSLIVYDITVYLNKQISSRKYQYTLGANLSLPEFKNIVWDSLLYNRPIMLLVDTEEFDYYKGKAIDHYVSLDYYNKSSETIRIKDCNYDLTYGGTHTGVSIEEAYEAISKGGYIIAYWD